MILSAATFVWNVYFHRLHKFPGPKLAAATDLPLIYHSINGDSVSWIVSLHTKYGDVVRVAPNELSFSGAESWKDIYGHRKGNSPTLIKDPAFYTTSPDEVRAITNADNEGHSRQRRIFAGAFSDRALKMQEPLFLEYVDKLVHTIYSSISKDPECKIDMVRMYNYTTFDIMGDLTFGEPLGMLDGSSYHPWVAAIFAGFHFGTYMHCIRRFPLFEGILNRLIPSSVIEKKRVHDEFSVARVERRLKSKEPRPDIWGLVLDKEDQSIGLTKGEMYANANIFMIGGTETTATLLSGLTFYLLRNEEALSRLTCEIRSTFDSESDITLERLASLQYLHACLEEGLRMYPPISNGLPRVVPPGGAQINGFYVPGGTKVYTTHLAAYRNAGSFKEPYKFAPERWLHTRSGYDGDKRHALQPFSLGPRMCLGKKYVRPCCPMPSANMPSMAYHEMRLILAKLLWNFDLTLCSESEKWSSQKIYLMWEKGPLFVRLRPAQPRA